MKYLEDDSPVIAENETNNDKGASLEAWRQDDYLRRDYILTDFLMN